jgi:hypothetical protein
MLVNFTEPSTSLRVPWWNYQSLILSLRVGIHLSLARRENNGAH